MDSRHVVVGIPTYNNEDTIGRTLELVLEQSVLPDRIVCCDKSDDRTPEVIERYQDNDQGVEIELIEQRGDGVADAYNQILEYVEGEYDVLVTLQTNLIVDDDWIEGHLEIHEDHPEIDMVTGDWKGFEWTDREVTPRERPYYVGRNFSVKPGVLEAIDGWDRNFLRGEDWDMHIRLAGNGTRTYARTAIGYEWQKQDPYITLSKAKRRPTSVSFLSKFGAWYIRFHPSHVVSDALSVSAVVTGALTVLTLPLAITSAVFGAMFLASVVAFVLGHNLLRGGVDESRIVGTVRKQFLNGISVLYALRRIVGQDVDWNRAGFDPENTPRYRF